jgi:hypothetical protein
MKQSELRQIIKEEISKVVKETQLEPYGKGKMGYSAHGYKLTKVPNVDKLLSQIKEIDGYLDLSRSDITTLPDNLEINGYLSLSNTKIETLPKGLVVRGDLDLLNCKKLKFPLPSDLVVHGNLVLNTKNMNKEELKRQLPNVNNVILMS